MGHSEDGPYKMGHSEDGPYNSERVQQEIGAQRHRKVQNNKTKKWSRSNKEKKK